MVGAPFLKRLSSCPVRQFVAIVATSCPWAVCFCQRIVPTPGRQPVRRFEQSTFRCAQACFSNALTPGVGGEILLFQVAKKKTSVSLHFQILGKIFFLSSWYLQILAREKENLSKYLKM